MYPKTLVENNLKESDCFKDLGVYKFIIMMNPKKETVCKSLSGISKPIADHLICSYLCCGCVVSTPASYTNGQAFKSCTSFIEMFLGLFGLHTQMPR
jgi:hypothetical protein